MDRNIPKPALERTPEKRLAAAANFSREWNHVSAFFQRMETCFGHFSREWKHVFGNPGTPVFPLLASRPKARCAVFAFRDFAFV